MLDCIDDLHGLFDNCIALVNLYMLKRKSKIDARTLLYYLIKLVKSGTESSITVASTLNNDNICNAKDSAFRKKRNKMPSWCIEIVSESLVHHYYEKTTFAQLLFNKYRVLAIDGTYCALSKNIEKDGFKLTQNKTYVSAPVNGIYDVINNICIDLTISNKSELDAYANQLHLLNKNDIIIHDRNYYSDKLAEKLNSLDVKHVFRIKKISRFSKYLIKNNKNDHIFTVNRKNIPKFKLRVIRYTVKKVKTKNNNNDDTNNDDNEYYIATNLFDKQFTLDVLKDLYKSRWKGV